MKISILPEPYPTFKSYMKQFGKNMIYGIPALVLVHFLNYAFIKLTYGRHSEDWNPFV